MNWHEQVVPVPRGEDTLVAIASLPEQAAKTGVVVVVGGPQYRAGSHRQFVLLARRLAAAGYPTLRFDYRGMGDSPGPLQQFESVADDVQAAIDALQAASPGVEQVVLWGLCDGASAALLYLNERADARVQGLALLNPWISTATTQASTRVRHYYLQRLMQRGFWLKLLGGKLADGALRNFFGSVGAAVKPQPGTGEGSYPLRMANAWLGFEGQTLLMLSDQDYTAREFEAYSGNEPTWRRALRERPPERVSLRQADHTCSQPDAERAMHEATLALLARVSHG